MTTRTLRNGDSRDLPIEPGQSMAVVAVSGTYSASVIAGLAAPSTIATNATGGTYGPYATGAVIRLQSSAASEIDFDVDVTPAIVSDTHVLAQTDAATGGVSLVAGGSVFGARAANTIAFYGDSLTEQAANYLTPPTTNQAQTSGAAFWIKGTELLCPSGAGTLAYNSTTLTLTWAANGESAGAATDASKSGMIYVPSSVANHGIYLNWFGGSRTYTTFSLAVTAKTAAFNLLDYRVTGFPTLAMAFAKQQLKLAYFQDVQNGNEAIYGLGGANSTDFLAASWQWSTIQSEIAVLCIGQNDAPAAVTATQTIANIKAILPLINAAKVVICTLPPRDSDTGAQGKAKQRINNWIYELCASSPRLVFFDLFSYLANPATGTYLAENTSDNVHLSGAGAVSVGKPMGVKMLELVGGSGRKVQRRGFFAMYDATDNIYGSSLATAGMDTFEGSGGTAISGISGTIPAGWKVTRTTGANIAAVGSNAAYTDKPGSDYRWTISGATTTEVLTLQPVATFSNGLAVGTVVECYLSLNVVSSTALEEISVQLYDNGSGTAVRGFYLASSKIKDFTGPLVIRTPDWTLPTGFTNLTALIKVGTGNAGAAVIAFEDFRVGPKQPV